MVLASGGGVTGGHLGQGERHGAVDEQDDNQTVEDGHGPAVAEPEDQGRGNRQPATEQIESHGDHLEEPGCSGHFCDVVADDHGACCCCSDRLPLSGVFFFEYCAQSCFFFFCGGGGDNSPVVSSLRTAFS